MIIVCRTSWNKLFKDLSRAFFIISASLNLIGTYRLGQANLSLKTRTHSQRRPGGPEEPAVHSTPLQSGASDDTWKEPAVLSTI